MRLTYLVLLFLAVAAAGCTTPSAKGNNSASSPETSTKETIAYSDCIELIGILPAPAASVEANLPPGFVATDDTGTLVNLVVYTGSCAAASVGSAMATEAAETWVVLPVGVPPEYDVAGVDGHFVILRGIVSHPAAAAVYADAGLGDLVSMGDVSVEVIASANHRLGQVRATQGTLDIDLAVDDAGSPITHAPFILRAYVVVAGELLGAVDGAYTSYQYLDGVGTSVATILDGNAGPMTWGQPGLGEQLWGFNLNKTLVPKDRLGVPLAAS